MANVKTYKTILCVMQILLKTKSCVQHTNFDYVYTCFAGDMKFDQGNDIL